MRKGIWTSFAMLVVLGGLNFASQGLMIPLYPIIEEEFGITHTEMGIVASSFVFLMVAFLPIWGYLADKYPRKKLLIIGCVVWSTTVFATIFARTYLQLLFLRLIDGIGIACFIPIAYSLSADFFPRGGRGKGAAWLYLLPALGASVGLAIATIYGPIYGWRFPFELMGIAGWAAASVFWFLMKEPKRAAGEPEFQKLLAAGSTYSYKIKRSHLKVLYRVKANLFLILQGFPGCVPWGILGTWLVTFLVLEEGFPILFAALFAVAFGGGNLLGSLLGGYLGDRIGRKGSERRVLFCIFGVLGGMILLWYPLLQDLPPLGLKGELGELPEFLKWLWGSGAGWAFDAFFFAGMLCSLTGPNWFALMQDINLPEVRGSVSAFNNLSNFIGVGVGPFLGGMLGDWLGLRHALLISTLPWIGCALLWVPVYWKLHPAERRIERILLRGAKEVKRGS